MIRRRFIGLFPAVCAGKPEEPARSVLWQSGENGYYSYRIPSLITTRRGTLLAFCEGRKDSRSDAGDIDLLVRRSIDGGGTWSEQKAIADFRSDTAGNPCPVQDRATGTIWFPFTANPGHLTEREIERDSSRGTRTVWLTHSRDEGQSWASPVEITRSVKDPGWGWYATGPGNGIQLRSGRLVIPCDHRRYESQARHSHIIYSDDGGGNWKIGGSAQPDTNECAVVELRDGTLMLNMRSYAGRNRRAIALSRDGGITWSDFGLEDQLIEPVCQASLIRYDSRHLLFSNPASTRRERLKVRASINDGRTWRAARLLHDGPAAYSSLAVLPDRKIACLYECGTGSAYETITLARFSLSWLMNGSNI